MNVRANLKSCLVMAMFLIAIGGGAAAGQIIYVDVEAPGVNNGSSWTDAYNYLQDALAVSSSGDEIWVAQGIYKPDQGAGVTAGDRTATFQLINGVAIEGGYAGFGEPEPNVRDVELYETILSGDLDSNDVEVNDPCDLWNEPSRAENCYHVVTGSGTDETAVLDGFTVTAGNANGYGSSTNLDGGGMFNSDGSPTLINCTFRNNSAASDGGGLFTKLIISNTTLTNCTFNGNLARFGGGIFDSGNAIVNRCTFISNSAKWGGGMWSNHWSTLSYCTFIRNSAAKEGGGLYNTDASATVTNCIFIGNSADKYGGGMYNFDVDFKVTNCTFIRNLAAQKGGGIYSSYFYHYNYPYENPTIINCILWENVAPEGTEIALEYDQGSSPSTLTVSHSDVKGGKHDVYVREGATLTWGTGNIDVDPCFAEPGYWADANEPNIIVEPNDPNAIWIDGDYHLLPDSPCIDAGDPNYVAEPNETDLDGKPRLLDGNNDGIPVIDMGAYEYSPPIPAEVRIVPRTINLASKGKWITCYVWLPEEHNVANIDPNSVFLEFLDEEIEAELLWLDEQQQVAMAWFRRCEVQGILNAEQVELTISGELTDGTIFEGTEIIRVIDKGGGKSAR